MKELHERSRNSAPYTSFILTNWQLSNHPVITTTLRFSPNLSFLPQIGNSDLISENQIRLQFALHPSSSQSTIAIGIWYAPLGTCINTVGDTILMYVEPWFSAEAGKDFLNRENGGGFYYTIFGEEENE